MSFNITASILLRILRKDSQINNIYYYYYLFILHRANCSYGRSLYYITVQFWPELKVTLGFKNLQPLLFYFYIEVSVSLFKVVEYTTINLISPIILWIRKALGFQICPFES